MTQDDVCICCKDIFESPDDVYKLTCGHVGHYECFYMSFKYNIKRGTTVLECPYCRKNTKPLPEKTGFNYCNFIHGGLSITNINSAKLFQWTANHEGLGYCKYAKNGSYCNVKFGDWGNGPSKDMCYAHKNYTHYGNNYCKACKSGKYCNNLITQQMNSQNYCWKHLNLENQLECSYVKSNGLKCLVITKNKDGICDKHNAVSLKKQEAFKCKEIFKSGKRKGETCNVINCKRHNKPVGAFVSLDASNKEMLASNNKHNYLDDTQEDKPTLNDDKNVHIEEIVNNPEETIFNIEETVNNTNQNYDIYSLDESSHNISYLCADIGNLIDELSDSTDILVENSLQVIKSLLISLKKNNNKLNE